MNDLNAKSIDIKRRLNDVMEDIIALDQAVEIYKKIEDAPIRVHINHDAAMVGDTLNTIPWILALAKRYGKNILVEGKFSNAVKPLVVGLPITFDSLTDPGPVIDFVADVKKSWDFCGPRGIHMLQGYFVLSGMEPPSLPVSLPLTVKDCGLSPGIVISPFCGSETQDPEKHVRVWYKERWNMLISFLISTGRTEHVYIVGGPNDDPTPFLQKGVTPVIGRPLTEIADLIQKSKLFISIDTGTSHLAHFCGVDRHLLLYPEVNFPTIHNNPRSQMLRSWPSEITIDLVIHEVAAILSK